MNRRAACFVVSCAGGLGIWLTTVATVGKGEDLPAGRSWLLWSAMVLLAAIFGYARPEDDGFIASGLVGAPLVIAGWTAPRGDGDGLWVLFFPYLVFMGFVLWLVAWLAGRVRLWLIGTSGVP